MSEDTDLRPLATSLRLVRLLRLFTEFTELAGDAADAAEAATREVDKSKGDSSSTLSMSRLKRVCLRYWIAGSRKASSGLSGTKKATSSVFGPTSLMRSNMGSPVGPFKPMMLTSSL